MNYQPFSNESNYCVYSYISFIGIRFPSIHSHYFVIAFTHFWCMRCSPYTERMCVIIILIITKNLSADLRITVTWYLVTFSGLKWQKHDPFMLGRTDKYWCNWSYKDRLTNSEFKTSLVFKPYWSVLEELIVTETLLSVWFNITSRFCITWEDFPDSTVSSILKKARNARTKTAEKSLTSYVELHICGRILIISASISTVIGLLMSARLCFRHTFQ